MTLLGVGSFEVDRFEVGSLLHYFLYLEHLVVGAAEPVVGQRRQLVFLH